MKPAALLLIALSLSVSSAQEAAQPKLSVHTLVREDIFAGFLLNDMERFEAGVKKLDRMIESNPTDAPALAWRGGAEVYRAVRAREAGEQAEFARLYERGTEMIERAYTLAPKDQGVLATSGGVYEIFADRLPPSQSAEAWKKAQSRFKALALEQAGFVDRLPLHMRGELLAGLAQSSHRVGELEEAQTYLRQIVNSLPGTPYEARARRWLDQPEMAATSSLVCQTCHEPGRLKNRLAGANK